MGFGPLASFDKHIGTFRQADGAYGRKDRVLDRRKGRETGPGGARAA